MRKETSLQNPRVQRVRGSSPSKGKILKVLSQLYPEPRSELHFRSSYELVTAVVLSAQCTDKKVNETTPELFKKYPTVRALAGAKVSDIEKVIRPINYYKTKSRHLVEMAKQICDEFKGEIPRTREGLESLPGVGRKTANVVLGELGIEKTIPVDTHVFRVARRLGFSKSEKPEHVEADIQAQFASKDWYNLHHWLIFHGRRVCKAQRPMCSTCSLAPLCPSVAKA